MVGAVAGRLAVVLRVTGSILARNHTCGPCLYLTTGSCSGSCCFCRYVILSLPKARKLKSAAVLTKNPLSANTITTTLSQSNVAMIHRQSHTIITNLALVTQGRVKGRPDVLQLGLTLCCIGTILRLGLSLDCT